MGEGNLLIGRSEWDIKRKIMERYNTTANIYDLRYADEQTAKIEAAIKIQDVKEKASVLDVGCGTGLLFDYISNSSERIIGLDLSKKMLLQAKKIQQDKKVQLILADADNIPLKKGVFSHVFLVTITQNMPDPVITLREVKRVTKKDGVIVVTCLKKKFSLEDFEDLLKKVGLKKIALANEGLKCYVAVCKPFSH
jgi:ubiquinone/menaquinone biosynthesis C-methylase UbiE